MAKARNQQTVRLHNQALILTLIRTRPNSSRADLSRASKLSKPVVASIVDGLIEAGLVEEGLTAEPTMGRPPVMLNISPDFYRIIGIDLSRDHLTVLVSTLDGECVLAVEEPFDISRFSNEDPRGEILDAVTEFVVRTGLHPEQIAGIGIGYPFPLSASRKLIIGDADVDEWRAIPLASHLRKVFNVPVYVDNDANLAALYEKCYGQANGYSDFLYLFIGTGVGAGLYFDDRLTRGYQGFAGEVGHITVVPNGELCVCGKRGCLETEISLQRFYQIVESASNDESLQAGIEHYAQLVGLYIGNFVNIFNPEAVIIGGAVVKESRIPFTLIEDVARQVAHPVLSNTFGLLLADIAENNVAKGAIVLAQQEIYRSPENHISSLRNAN